MDNIVIYTDGACSGNPGRGGWGAILLYQKKDQNGKLIEYKKTISGGSDNTTNNKMELTAVIEALKVLKKPCVIDLYSDSKYVLDGITQWMPKWVDNNWKTANKKPVKNKELWIELDNLLKQHSIHWNWVKGHADDVYNNEVDKLARNMC